MLVGVLASRRPSRRRREASSNAARISGAGRRFWSNNAKRHRRVRYAGRLGMRLLAKNGRRSLASCFGTWASKAKARARGAALLGRAASRLSNRSVGAARATWYDFVSFERRRGVVEHGLRCCSHRWTTNRKRNAFRCWAGETRRAYRRDDGRRLQKRAAGRAVQRWVGSRVARAWRKWLAATLLSCVADVRRAATNRDLTRCLYRWARQKLALGFWTWASRARAARLLDRCARRLRRRSASIAFDDWRDGCSWLRRRDDAAKSVARARARALRRWTASSFGRAFRRWHFGRADISCPRVLILLRTSRRRRKQSNDARISSNGARTAEIDGRAQARVDARRTRRDEPAPGVFIRITAMSPEVAHEAPGDRLPDLGATSALRADRAKVSPSLAPAFSFGGVCRLDRPRTRKAYTRRRGPISTENQRRDREKVARGAERESLAQVAGGDARIERRRRVTTRVEARLETDRDDMGPAADGVELSDVARARQNGPAIGPLRASDTPSTHRRGVRRLDRRVLGASESRDREQTSSETGDPPVARTEHRARHRQLAVARPLAYIGGEAGGPRT